MMVGVRIGGGWRKKRQLNKAGSQSITSPNALSGLRSGSSVSRIIIPSLEIKKQKPTDAK